MKVQLKTRVLKLAVLILSLVPIALAKPVLAQNEEVWPQGFYRKINESRVYWLADRGTDGRLLMCSVMGSSQMDAFGGAGIVRVVGPKSSFRSNRIDTGICPWPDGIYREANWNGQWKYLYSNSRQRFHCNITTTQHLNAYNDGQGQTVILTVPNNSRLEWRRIWQGDCVWPSQKK